MAANTSPIYPLTPKVGFAVHTAANTNLDGTGTVATLATAGADGAIVRSVTFQAQGTNVATVARLFINNGSTTATATNNTHFLDVTLPATTASATTALTPITVNLNIMLQATYTITACIATAVSGGIAYTCLYENF
jgi:hypothetical protein